MQYSVGDKVEVQINKIQENGCFCTFVGQKQFGFLPNNCMPSLFTSDKKFTKEVGDRITVVINQITERGILLADLSYFLRQKERQRTQSYIDDFISKYEKGDVFEAEVVDISKNSVCISIDGIPGIIRKEDTFWNEIDSLDKLLFKGEIVHAVYIKHEQNRLYFSLKLLKEKPYDEKLYDLSLNALLQFVGHDSNAFIGQAKRYSYGLFIDNLYSSSKQQTGKLLIDPIYGYNLKAIVLNASVSNVQEGEYYGIKLALAAKQKRLDRNQLFQFVATDIEKVENPYKRDVELAFQRNTTNPSSNQRDAKLLDEIGKNMYSSKERMFFELIQNADDAAAEKGVLIAVKTQGDYLLLQHNGYSFDKEDFVSITTAANGTKKANENKTGYKGIGFKSVFTDSILVYINTGGYQFKFDKSEPIFQDFDAFYLNNNRLIVNEEAKNIFLELYADYKKQFDGIHSIPWQLEPIWVDNFPEELGDNFTSANVSIALKLGINKIEGNNGYNQAITDTINDPKFMLFLRNTKRIDFNDKSISRTNKDGKIILKNSFNTNQIEYFERKDFAIPVNNDIFAQNHIDIRIRIEKQDTDNGRIIEATFVDLHNQDIENIPKKIALNNSTEISFAVPVDEDGALKPIMQRNAISMFAFLPTLVKDFRFPFYINANFILDPPRQRILGDSPWNFYLMQEIARCMVRWCSTLCEKEDKNALNILIPQLFEENSADTALLAHHFNATYKSALDSQCFILNHKGQLVQQSEIVLDKTGLSSIIGADLFCRIMKTDKSLPSPKIDSQILDNEIFEQIRHFRFNDTILAITNNQDFNEWFISATECQKQALYDWIDEHSNIQGNALSLFVSRLPLFTFAEQHKSREQINTLSNYIITTEHIVPIKDVLSTLGFMCSEEVFNEKHPLCKYITPQDEEILFNTIKVSNFSELEPNERRNLFLSLSDFSGIGEAKLKAIALFRNMNGEFTPLGDMVGYRDNVQEWLRPYVICRDDYFRELSDYLIEQENEFVDVIQKHYNDINIPLAELYETYKNVWTGNFTRSIIDHYDVNSDLLSIIEESDKQTKRYFLDSRKRIDLLSASFYPKTSYEYRVLKLALEVYEEDPSIFSSKIYFDGRCIKEFSVSDEVVCDFYQKGVNKKVKMSLAQLLPQYQNQSDSIDKIKSLFEEKKNLDTFFSDTPKTLDNVHQELNKYLNIPEAYFSLWNVEGNAYQYLFATYYRRQRKGWNNLFVPKIELKDVTTEFLNDLLLFLFENNISIEESPFTYHLKGYFINKCFGSDYVSEEERLLPSIETWVANDEKRRQYLTDNGVRTSECLAVQFRRDFLENKSFDAISKLSNEDLQSGINFVATATMYAKPFTGDQQKDILLSIRKQCNWLLDTWDMDKILHNSTEWDTNEYKIWIKDHNLHIFIFAGKLPRQLSYGDILLLNYETSDNDYYYDQAQQTLYVCDTRNIDDILFEIARGNKARLTLDDYRLLCMEGKISVSKEEYAQKDEKIRSLHDENQRKDEIIERYRTMYGDLPSESTASILREGSSEDSFLNQMHNAAQEVINIQTGKVITRDSISQEEQITAHKEAARKIKSKLEMNGYNCSKWDITEDIKNEKWHSINQIEGIINSEGETINLVVKSVKGGYIYLSATDFEFLTSNRNNVLVVWDGNNVHSVTAEEIFQKDSNVNLIFDTEYTPKHYYAALSKVFQYIKRTTFAVKNPQYNAYDTIKSFGLDSKTEGVQDLFNDDNAL